MNHSYFKFRLILPKSMSYLSLVLMLALSLQTVFLAFSLSYNFFLLKARHDISDNRN